MDTPLHILIVAPGPERAEALVELLSPQFGRLEYVLASEPGALADAAALPWDLVLAETCVRGCDPFRLLEPPRRGVAGPPLVVLAERPALDEGLELMRRGAADYLDVADAARLPEVVARALRRGREARAAAGEERFLQNAQFVLEKAAEAVVWLDAMGRIFFANDAAGAMLGYTRAEMQDMAVFDVDRNLSREQWAALWTRLREEHSFEIHVDLTARDGSLVPSEISLNMLVLGGRECMTGFARDVTLRRAAEQARGEEESRYRSLFEDCPISLWEEDLSEVKLFLDSLRERGVRDFRAHFAAHAEDLIQCVLRVRIIDVNKATLRLLEAGSKAELLAGLDKVFTEDSLRVAVEEFSDLADGKFSYSGELDHKTMTGRTIRVAVHFNVAPEYRDTLGRVVVSLMDVTDIRRMQRELEDAKRGLEQRVEERTHALEEANEHLRREIAERGEVERMLRVNESRLRTLVDRMPVLIHAHDEQGRYVFWNRESERVLGYGAAETADPERLQRMMYPDDAYRTGAERMYQEAGGEPLELATRTKDGRTRLIRWTRASEPGPLPGWFYWEAGIDMTDVRAAEGRIHSLTHDLLRAQETERSRIALELHDNVAQNLSSLKIGCETLFDNETTIPDALRWRSRELAGILQECISAVRDMSYDLRPPGLDQLGLVQALEQFCRDSARESGVDIRLTAAGMETLRLGYDVEINLYRLVQEAVRNALRHAGAGLVSVKLVASSPHLILRVEDDGAGFDVQARRASLHEDRRMGLQSMEERARLLGGQFRITSRMDKGTRIFVQIPFGEK